MQPNDIRVNCGDLEEICVARIHPVN